MISVGVKPTAISVIKRAIAEVVSALTQTSFQTSITDPKTGHVYSFVAADGVTPEAREVWQYVSGNWGVLGSVEDPVRVGSITPASTSISTAGYVRPDNIDDAGAVGAQTRWMHGAMLNPWSGQGPTTPAPLAFDNYYGQAAQSASMPYDHALNIDPGKTGSPIELTEGSIVKSESVTPEGGHSTTALDKTRMLRMSILTVATEVPAANSFRPGPRAPSKLSPLSYQSEAAFEARMTATRQIISGFRPFTTAEIAVAVARIEFVQQTFAPFQEQARRWNPGAHGGGCDIYGDDWYYWFQFFFACYHGDYTNEEVKPLTKAVIQVGVDIYGLLQDDSYYFGWQAHHAGRKGIVFAAGHILGNQDILDQCDYNLHPEHFGVDDAICGYVNSDMIGAQPRWYRKAFPHKWEDTHLGIAEWSNVFCPGTAPTAPDVETTDQVVDAGILERDYNVLSVDRGAMYQALWGMICDPTAQYYNPAYFDFMDRYLAHRFGDQIHGDFDISGDEASTNGVTIGNWYSINPSDATVVHFQTMRNACPRTNYVLSMVPEALQIPTVTHDGSSGHLVVDLNWNNVLVPRTEDVAVIRYDIRWKAYVGGADTAASESADNYFGSYEWQYIEGVTFPYNLSDVPRNEKVQVQVRAVNANGEGHWLSDEKRENYADTNSQPPFVALSGYRRYARNFDVPDIAAFDKIPLNFKAPSTDRQDVPTGSVVTASDGQWSGTPAVSATDYRWQVSDDGSTGWSDISGATSAAFTTTATEEGKFLQVGVRKTNSVGTSAYVYSEGSVSVVAPIFRDIAAGYAPAGVFDTGEALGGKRLLVLYTVFTGSPVTYGGSVGAYSFGEAEAIHKDNSGTTSNDRWRFIAYIINVPEGETATSVVVASTQYPEVAVYELDQAMTLTDYDDDRSGLTLTATSVSGGGAFWWGRAGTSTSIASSPTVTESASSVSYGDARTAWGHDFATPDGSVAVTHNNDPGGNMRAVLITLQPAA